MAIHTPIFVFDIDSRDLSSHDSLEAAERYIEAIDVRAGIYEIYDASGYLLEAHVKHDGCFLGDSVFIAPSEPVQTEPDRFRRLLLDFLQLADRKSQSPSELAASEQTDLDTLVKRAHSLSQVSYGKFLDRFLRKKL